MIYSELVHLGICDIGGYGAVCADAALIFGSISLNLSVLLIPLVENEC